MGPSNSGEAKTVAQVTELMGSFSGLEADCTGSNDPRVAGYEVLSMIGSGGMGVVYKARHRELNRIVALKLLLGAALVDPEYRNRFRAEAEAVARLQHPNIIQIFEVGVAEQLPGESYSTPFISLEFVDGGSLTEKTDKPQSPRYAAEMVEKLARAVHSAHAQGVIHRDLKPANVLLTRDGEPKVADFGIAKQVGVEHVTGEHASLKEGIPEDAGQGVTQAGMVIGTPEYMSPEQVAGRSPTPAFDIYALGVILYQLLTARVPFQGSTPTETLRIALDQEPVSPRRFKPALSRDLETICLKCLEKNPDKRYPSALALADDLRRFLDGHTITARRVSDTERLARWCMRNPLVTASLVCVATTVLLAFLLISYSYWQADYAWHRETLQREAAERKEKAERWERYRANITATASLLEIYDAGGARRNLQASPEVHRNWEWWHFNSRVDQAHTVLDFTESRPTQARISGDGSRVVIFGDDQLARVYRTSDGQVVQNLTTTPSLKVANLSHNGRWLAAPDGDGPVVLRNLDDDRVMTFLGLNKRPHTFVLNYDGTRLAAATESTVQVWDTTTGQSICVFNPYKSHAATTTFSPNGRRILVANDKTKEVGVWDANSGKLVALLPGHEEIIDHAWFSRDSSRVVTCIGYPINQTRLWDVESGKLLGRLSGHTNTVNHCMFSPDGTQIATCSMDQTVRLWDGLTGKSIASWTGHTGWLYSVDFSPDGNRLVTSSQDHTLRVWDVVNREPVNVLLGHATEALGARYTPDGKSIVSFDKDGIVRLWDARKVEFDHVLRGHDDFVYSVAFHPDGKRVVSGAWDGTARFWDANAQCELSRIDHGKGQIVVSVALHPDGKLVATRTREAIFLWDVDSGKKVDRWDTPSHKWLHTRLAFSPNGELLASGGPDHSLYLWDMKSRTEYARLPGHNAPIRDVVFSTDGKWVASAGEAADPTIRIWDLEKKLQVKVLEGHTGCVYSLGLSKDGTLLASGSRDGTVHLWDTKSWSETAVLKHGTDVYSVAFTPDGTRLACACANNTIRLWDIATGQQVVDLRGHKSYVHSLAFSPDDGRRLVSGSGDKTLRIWDTNRP